VNELDFIVHWSEELNDRMKALLDEMLATPDWTPEHRERWRSDAKRLAEELDVLRSYGEVVIAGSDAQTVKFTDAEVTSVDGLDVETIDQLDEIYAENYDES